MQYLRFGNTGMMISRFSLGAMVFGEKLDLASAGRAVDEAIDHGVNLIDTADSYGDSEAILGQILSPEKRQRVYLATKVFKRFCRDGRVGRNSRVNIINALHRSLKLLNTDYVDLYQLHHPDPDTPIEETLSALDVLVKQGKIRYVGVSNHYAWQMAYMIGLSKAENLEPIVSIQADYNILDRQIEPQTVPFCERFNIALMCYGPLCGGILTGKYHGPENIPEDSRAAKMPVFKSYLQDPTCLQILDKLRLLAAENGVKMNQLAILWLMAKPYVTNIILGGSRPEHYTQIYEIADRQLPQELVQRIDELSASRVYRPFLNQAFRQGPPLAGQRAPCPPCQDHGK